MGKLSIRLLGRFRVSDDAGKDIAVAGKIGRQHVPGRFLQRLSSHESEREMIALIRHAVPVAVGTGPLGKICLIRHAVEIAVLSERGLP